MTSDSDIPPIIPTILWGRQQHSAGLTTQAFVGRLSRMAANDETVIAADAPYRDFALKLAKGMRRSRVTAKDIEIECEVNDETVRLWRRGQRMPRDKSMKRLATMIGVKPSDLRFNESAPSPSTMPALSGEHVTDEDELALLKAYRGLKKEWARRALRARAVELLEQFGEKGATNPWGQANTQ